MKKSLILALALLVGVVYPTLAVAQVTPTQKEYRLNVGDKLYLSAPQRPSLNRNVIIDPDGTVELPLIGKVRAAGLTVPEFETALLHAIGDYYPSITEVTVNVEEMMGQVVYVTGHVGKPGRYSFSDPPNLWEAIREAGGPRPNAAMTQVQIVADEATGGQTRTINVQDALESGSVEMLPELRAGDTVIVPSMQEEYTGTQGVNIVGAVSKPGIYRLQGRQDLMSALLMAGGPTRRAKLSEVRIIQPRADGSYVTEVYNLQRYLEAGDATSNPRLGAGYTVNVPEQNPVSYQVTNNFGIVLSVITSVLSITWLVIRIQDR